MKIAVVHNLRRGGAARRMTGTVRALVNQPGVEVREFALSAGVGALDDPSRVRIDCDEHAERVPRLVRPPMRYVDNRRFVAAWGRLAAEVNGWSPDAVFANPCGVLLAAPPSLGRLTAPSLYYCDEPRRHDYEQAAAASTNPRTRGLYGPLRASQMAADRAAIAAAGQLATNCAFTAGGIERAYGRSAVVVTPGIAPVFTAIPSAVAVLAHVVSVGSLIPSKGHDLAITALGLSGLDLPMILVAPRDDPAERRRLTAIAATARVRLDIRIGISDGELVDLYRSALATVYLARQEPLGLVSLESQACGTPVVVADEGGLGETVENGVTGFRVTRDAASAATALTAIADPTRRTAMARAVAARPVARDESSARQILGLLGTLADNPAEAISA